MPDRIMIAAVMKVELPDHTARISEGGVIEVGGESYGNEDERLGTPASFENLSEGVGDEAPAAAITFNPPGGVTSTTLNDAAQANSRIRIWIAELDEDSGLQIGDAEQIADLIVDNPSLKFDNNVRQLEFACVSSAERLFLTNKGNSLSPSYHEQTWPGEKGLANASGVSRSVAWGAASAPRGSATGGAGGGGGGDGSGGGGGLNFPIQESYI